MTSPLSYLRGLVACLTVGACAGCASVLPTIDRAAIASEALAPSADTALGRMVAASTPDAALSGFRLMPLGSFSFDTRIQLVRRAQASLDVQYYRSGE